ncbi:hypothetical protein BAU15_00595 [Enterococcus sp. JM4C]|nr:hypothetical protein BAU15_00595 [Enterococcus sp. JM4C]
MFFKLLLLIVIVASTNTIVSYLSQIGITAALERQQKHLILAFGLMILFNLVFGFTIYFYDIEKEKVRQYVSKKIKNDLLNRLLVMDDSELSGLKSGDLVITVNEDSEICASYITNIVLPAIQMVCTIVIGLVYIFFTSYVIGLMALLTIPIFYTLNRKIFKRLEDNSAEIRTMAEKMTTFSEEYFNNLPIIRLYRMQKKLAQKYERLFEDKYQKEVTGSKIRTILKYNTEMQILGSEMLCIVLGIVLLRSGSLSIGELIGITNVYIGSIIWPIIDLPTIVSELAVQFSSWTRIERIFNRKITDTQHKEKNYQVVPSETNQLVIDRVSFSYRKNPVLSNINMSVKQGEIVYIVGDSGAGKSTLIHLICGILPLKEGTIQLYSDEVKVEDSLFDSLSYVPQKNNLLPFSVADNLNFGRVFSTEDLNKALADVGLLTVVNASPHGLESRVGKDINFSVGESQRLLIARSILHDKRIMILDEPFSSLDEKNIAQVLKLLRALKKDKILLIVSHHIPTLTQGESIFRLERSKP